MLSPRKQHVKSTSFELVEEDDSLMDTPFDSDKVCAKIQDWIKDCLGSHERCKYDPSNRKFPKRLLEVCESKSGPKVRLVELDANRDIPPYYALSHCWGRGPMTWTELRTLDELQDHMHFSSLNYTFRDVVRLLISLCPCFDVRHIWIDSLCIIQDCSHDWETEAAKMASIYENAFLVIAASSAPDGSYGIFQPRFPLPKVANKQVLNQRGILHARTFDAYAHDLFTTNPALLEHTQPEWMNLALHDNPLFTRGWALQERLLATRCLHFTRGEIILECKSNVKCECGAFARRSQSWQLDSLEKNDFQNFVERKWRDTSVAWSKWWDYVERFSKRKLTKYDDILPAISGLARKVAGEDLGDYVCGMWTRDLAQNLLWRLEWSIPMDSLDTFVRAATRETSRTGPSWSWISANPGLGVKFRRGYSNKRTYPTVVIAEVLDVSCNQSGPDPYGKIEGGILSIRGYTVEAIAERVEGSTLWDLYQMRWPDVYSSFLLFPDGNLLGGVDYLDPGKTVLKCLLVATETEKHIIRNHGVESAKPFPYLYESVQERRRRRKDGRIRDWTLEEHEHESPVDQYCRHAEDLDVDSYWGLALLPVKGCTATYRRIGVCYISASWYAKLIESEVDGEHIETVTII